MKLATGLVKAEIENEKPSINPFACHALLALNIAPGHLRDRIDAQVREPKFLFRVLSSCQVIFCSFNAVADVCRERISLRAPFVGHS